MANPADGVGMAGVVECGRRDQISNEPSLSRMSLGLRAKRWLDVSLALVMLVVLAPLALLIALIVKLDSPGPILFRQERIGQNGRRFHIMKFRSMTDGAPSVHHRRYIAAMTANCQDPRTARDAASQAEPAKPFEDPNITRVGRWLRKTSLDELPQLVNVLRGDMSLVGPRPLPAYEISGLAEWAHCRLEMPQGMTGLWQVSGRSALPYVRMLELDIEYIERWSLRGDLVILLKTVGSIARDWDKTA